MSSIFPTPEQSPQDSTSPQGHQVKPHRVLACQLCQQRKVKCDRKFPCSNCTKAGVQCLSASLVQRQRRRRFPERALLDRVRHYEDLLRKNNIPFEPLHPSSEDGNTQGYGAATDPSYDFGSSPGQEAATEYIKEEPTAAKNFWHAMNSRPQDTVTQYREPRHENDMDDDDSDDSSYIVRENDVKEVWDSLYDASDELLFCARDPTVELSSLHPNQMQIFQLWQKYLENVDPLLKVTHTPTLQARIISAACDVANIRPNLEALMFSIYCMAIFSMSDKDCIKQFSTPRYDLLTKYQHGTRQALINSGFLKTTDRECLTALHLYLLTVKPNCDPRSLSSILGLTVRIAQRIKIHDDASNAKFPVLEAELRRRLWWSLVIFDARIAEMTEFKSGQLLPTWFCKPPLNVNDVELRLESKVPPAVHGNATEALFAVMRAEMADFIRGADFHLDFINPSLKSITRKQQSQGDELDLLEKYMEDKYISHCEPGNPMHFMATWWIRGAIAKSRFIRHLAEAADPKIPRDEAHRDAGISYALRMLECDTKIVKSKLTHGFRWMTYLNFPFPAFVHIVNDLRRRPIGDHAVHAWEVMSDNCATRFLEQSDLDSHMARRALPFHKIFYGVVMAAWKAREIALLNSGMAGSEQAPQMILQLRAKMELLALNNGNATDGLGEEAGEVSVGDIDLNMNAPMDVGTGFLMGGGNGDMMGQGMDPFSLMHMQPPMNMEVNHFGWPSMHGWNTVGGTGW